MAFKGSIAAGGTVSVTLALNFTAKGPAPLLAAFGRSEGGGTAEDGTVIAPGSSDGIELDVDAKGMLRIVVDMSDESDSGMLTVAADGSVVSSEAIMGDTTWVYTIKVADA